MIQHHVPGLELYGAQSLYRYIQNTCASAIQPLMHSISILPSHMPLSTEQSSIRTVSYYYSTTWQIGFGGLIGATPGIISQLDLARLVQNQHLVFPAFAHFTHLQLRISWAQTFPFWRIPPPKRYPRRIVDILIRHDAKVLLKHLEHVTI